MNDQKTKLKLCSIWQKTIKTKNGEMVIFTGSLGDLSFEIWPNGFKKTDKSPTHVMYLKEKYKKEETATAQAASIDFGPEPLFTMSDFDTNEPIPF